MLLLPLTIPSSAEEKDHDKSVPGWGGKGNPLMKQGGEKMKGGKPRKKKDHVSSTFSSGSNTDHWTAGEAWAEVQLQTPALKNLWNPKHLPREQKRFWDPSPRRY